MEPDLALVIGLVLGVIAMVTLFSGFSNGRTSYAGVLLTLVAGTLVVYAVQTRFGGYTINEIPEVIIKVVGRYVL